MIATAGGTLVIVTHTIPLRACLWAFLSLPFHGLYAFPECTATAITEWVVDDRYPGRVR